MKSKSKKKSRVDKKKRITNNNNKKHNKIIIPLSDNMENKTPTTGSVFGPGISLAALRHRAKVTRDVP